MGIEEIRNLKNGAREPKPPKYGLLNKKSTKTLTKEKEDRELLKLDREFYNEIWIKKEHTCLNCGEKITNKRYNWHFHHLLPKSEYPQFRHTEANCILLCLTCHSKCETNYDFIPKIRHLKELTEKLLLK